MSAVWYLDIYYKYLIPMIPINTILGAIGIFVYVGVEVGIPGTLNLWLSDANNLQGAEVGKTIAGFVVGTYWFLMLIGRLLGAAIGSKVSSNTM